MPAIVVHQNAEIGTGVAIRRIQSDLFAGVVSEEGLELRKLVDQIMRPYAGRAAVIVIETPVVEWFRAPMPEARPITVTVRRMPRPAPPIFDDWS